MYPSDVGGAGAPSTSPASAAATASPPATFSALFCATRDLLFLLLPRWADDRVPGPHILCCRLLF